MEAQARIVALRSRLAVRPEFKFNKCCSDHRDAFFRELSGVKFRTRAVVVQKQLIYSKTLRTGKDTFYKFFVRMMMQHDGGSLIKAKVVIDGSGDRTFKREFKSYIRRHIGSDCVSKLDLKDSERDPLLQLADMTAGAVARSYKLDREDRSRWRAMLERSKQLENVWEFR